MSNETLESIIDLTQFYDYIIVNESNDHCIVNHFLNDLYPLIQVVSSLFYNLKTKKKLILFNNFFTKLFDLKSKELRQSI